MNKFKYKNCILVVFFCASAKILIDIIRSGKVEHPYLGYTFHQYLSNLSFHVENHTATTSDGYILALHRIPCKRFDQGCCTQNKIPILMIHGLCSSVIEWIVQGPDVALGLRLANAGYDVWLANNRGVLTSRNHTTLDPNKDSKFWDYSYHELGVYDTPALIDYVLASTNKSQLYYVGDSQGATQFLVMGSEKTNYTDKVRLATFLAPALGIVNGTGIHRRFMRVLYSVLETTLTPFDIYSIQGSRSVLGNIVRAIVLSNEYLYDLFIRTAIFILGGSLEHTNIGNFTFIYQHCPSESALKQFKHYLQTGVGELFRQFDYGKEENLRRYNSTTPPQYNISKIETPVAVFYTRKDQFMEKFETETFMKDLPNVIKSYEVPCENFYHQDIVMGTNITERVLGEIFNVIVKFDPN